MPMTEAKRIGADWLKNGGVRPTRQRVSLAAMLVGDGQHRHVTAESLFDAVRGCGEKVSLATVYNTLRAFSEAGLLREITVNGTKSYFDTDTTNHAHFYCEDTGALSDVETGTVTVTDLPAPPAGTEISKVDVVIRIRHS